MKQETVTFYSGHVPLALGQNSAPPAKAILRVTDPFAQRSQRCPSPPTVRRSECGISCADLYTHCGSCLSCVYCFGVPVRLCSGQVQLSFGCG